MAEHKHKDQPAPATENGIIPFEDAVRKCKEIRARIEGRNEETERDHFRIGEIADKVETKYKDRTHAKLAERSNIAYSCLKRYLSVYRAWKGTPFGAPGPQSVSYSVLRELASLEDREQIIRDNPNITKREAEQLRRERDGKGDGNGEPQGSFRTDNRRYLKDVCTRAEDLRKKAEEALDDTDEQLDDLAKLAGEQVLMNLRADAKVVVGLAELLLARRRQLEDQEAEEQTQQTDPEDAEAPQATEHAYPEASIQVEA
jgi:hypothetical protein